MKILLALDGSAESNKAIEQLVRLPFRSKPDVRIVTAVRESPLDLETDIRGVAIYEAAKKQALANIEIAKSKLQASCGELEHCVEHAHPNALILREAEKYEADLIVMGARGHNAIYRVVVGSTTEFVSSHAKCNVLVVRGEATESDWKLLLPYDGSDPAQLARCHMNSFHWPESTSLHIAMLLERPSLIPETEVYDPPELKRFANEVEGIESDGFDPEKVTRTVREAFHIGTSLREMAENDNTNLIFVGATGKSAVAQFFLGSVSRYLLHHAPCSIFLARPTTWPANE